MKNFQQRHIGIQAQDEGAMLKAIGVDTLDQLVDETVPSAIRIHEAMGLDSGMSEYQFLQYLKKIAGLNQDVKSLIGRGYYGTVTPPAILRNIFENPGWYTQYTPYQAEISQGRLEALLNFQTMVSDLTGLPVANASLLDEGTAAAEAMAMFYGLRNKRAKGMPVSKFLVATHTFEQTVDVIRGRAEPLEIDVIVDDWNAFDLSDDVFAILLQYPDALGSIEDYRKVVEQAHDKGIYVVVAADLLSLTLLVPPGEWGADAVVGNTQRFGVPMGCGGPHAAFFATSEKYKRQIPGRIIGVSIDAHDRPALRMALQTREQHIKRERATSNICTAQALLAIMASMYGVYHGPDGFRQIATQIHDLARQLASRLESAGIKILNRSFFDTLTIEVKDPAALQARAEQIGYNVYCGDNSVGISLDETCNSEDLHKLVSLFDTSNASASIGDSTCIPDWAKRTSDFMTHPVFHVHRTETQLMRYVKSLENKDLSLVHSMIPLGSCTMKLNAAVELIPVSWPEFSTIHPFAPAHQLGGYNHVIEELEEMLCKITGFTACSLQPNSGAQGEFAGLQVIRAYHKDRGENHRNVTLIPESAHGTNPASAVMAGTRVVVVACDEHGNVDLDDLKSKAEEHSDHLAALMITYPSTHGVFENAIMEVCEIVHQNGGLVYMDGANMNAQVGLTNPARIGADVCHLNLHKTFAIPHGGGGPGMGPICVNDKLKPFLPGHVFSAEESGTSIHAISAAEWGSASILLISYAYIKLLGEEGVTNATRYAILNANYIKSQLEEDYQILYSGENGRAAHELIVDLRPFKAVGVTAEDVAKRLIDYGFHAPTLSFPVAGTIMIEPTESEDKLELDRFIEAMKMIKAEIDEIARGEADSENNVLHNAPHSIHEVTSDTWPYPYSREKAAYPLEFLKTEHKFWIGVSRVNNGYGDRNLICVCPPIEAYMD